MIYAYINDFTGPSGKDQCIASTYDMRYVPEGVEVVEFPDGTELELVNGVITPKTQAEIDSEQAAIVKAQKVQNQIQKMQEYTLQGFQIIMAEVDYLRPAAKAEQPAWTAMKAKIQQLEAIVNES